MKLSEKIDIILNEYESYRGDTTQYQNLLRLRKELSIRSVELAKIVAINFKKKSYAYAKRKVNTAISTLNHSENFGITQSQAMAEKDIENYRNEEIRTESEYQASKLMLDQVNKVLDAMAGDIQAARKEWERINYTT